LLHNAAVQPAYKRAAKAASIRGGKAMPRHPLVLAHAASISRSVAQARIAHFITRLGG
jgi:hypothetical protein